MSRVLKVQKRLLPHIVARAAARKGMKAITGGFMSIQDGQPCGCALTIKFITPKEVAKGYFDYSMTDRARNWGLTHDYVDGVINGFDGGSLSAYRDNEYKQGHQDGVAILRHLRKKGLVVDRT